MFGKREALIDFRGKRITHLEREVIVKYNCATFRQILRQWPDEGRLVLGGVTNKIIKRHVLHIINEAIGASAYRFNVVLRGSIPDLRAIALRISAAKGIPRHTGYFPNPEERCKLKRKRRIASRCSLSLITAHW